MKVIDNQGRTKDVGLIGPQGVGVKGNKGDVGPTGPGNGFPSQQIIVRSVCGGF